MTLRKITIFAIAIILLFLGVKFGYGLLNKKNAEEKKAEPYVIEEETVKSAIIYDYNFYLKSPMVVEVTYTADDSCGGLDKIHGMCDGKNKFELKGVMEGESTLWIVQDRDLSNSTRKNTKVYKVIVDKDLNVTIEKISYRPLNFGN